MRPKLFGRLLSTGVAPITSPTKGGRAISIGDIVEYKDFMDECRLGVVFSISTTQNVDRVRLKVLNKDYSEGSTDSFFIKFHSPFLLGHQVQRNQQLIDDIQSFYQEAKSILEKEFSKMEKVVSKRYPEDSTGYRKLIYEGDLAQAVFGTAYTPQQLYAIHLYLHSYSDKFGKDAAYMGGENHAVYFLRSAEDLALIERARTLVSESSSTIKAFQEDVAHCLKMNIPLEVRPGYDTFLECLIKAATCSWQDFDGNPFQAIVASILKGVAPVYRYRDFAALAGRLGLTSFGGLEVDLALSQSGLNLKIHQVKTDVKSKIIQPADGSEELEGNSSYGDEDNPAIAIDSASTIEVDDAISMSKDGEWIHIHVAHPSRLIPAHSPLDLDAQSRALTIYTTKQKYSMLPWSFASKVTLDPLNPLNQVMTFSARLDSSGDIADYSVTIGVLNNLKRMTYQQADEFVDENPKWLRLLETVIRHHDYRTNQGALTFSLPKGEVYEVDGKLTFSLFDIDSPSRFLVSECMIIAGRVAALYSQQHNIPAPFRYHVSPAESGDKETIELIETLQAERKNASLYNGLCLLSKLSSSAVDLQPRHHWAMGLKEYSKCTSPIRRYLDLLLHRQLRSALIPGNKAQSYDELRTIIPPVFRHEQYLKRLVRSSDRYWTIKYLEQEFHDLRARNERFIVTALIVDYNQHNRNIQLYIPQFALRTFDQISGGSELHAGKLCPLEIIDVNPLRQSIYLATLD